LNDGQGGRLLLSTNVAVGLPGSVTGAHVELFEGPLGQNPYLRGPAVTPYIPDLRLGASPFGLLQELDANASAFAAVRDARPARALGALLRLDVGPGGYADDFTGFDALLFLNLTGAPLGDPLLGLGGADLWPLMSLGTTALAVGMPASALGSLDAYAVWMTLIPDSVESVAALATGTMGAFANLLNGDFVYLIAPGGGGAAVPAPPGLPFVAFGLGVVLLLRRRR